MSESSRTTSNIYPCLSYDDAPTAIEWLCAAFNFTKRLSLPCTGRTRRVVAASRVRATLRAAPTLAFSA